MVNGIIIISNIEIYVISLKQICGLELRLSHTI